MLKLWRDRQLVVHPSRVVADGGRDVAGADFLFGQELFVHELLFHQDGWSPGGVFWGAGHGVVSVASSIAQDGQLGKRLLVLTRIPFAGIITVVS